jgi:hypothetical protein
MIAAIVCSESRVYGAWFVVTIVDRCCARYAPVGGAMPSIGLPIRIGTMSSMVR